MPIIFSYSITVKMLFCIFSVFVFTHDISSGSDPFYVSNDEIDDNRENDYDIDFYHENYELYRISKHVFYWLYTRDNTDGQLLNRSEEHMIESTTYDVENPIKVIVHGWLGTTQEKEGLCSYHVRCQGLYTVLGSNVTKVTGYRNGVTLFVTHSVISLKLFPSYENLMEITFAYFKVGEYNLICVDWKQYSTDVTYAVAKAKAKLIGKDIAEVLIRITANMTMGCYDSVHVIGHSMGAHIAGFVGKNFPSLSRITGLDPAKPMYEKSGPEDRLDMTDANYVDVMHTNAGKNGLNKSIGHMDFYPNGGVKQPGCENKDKTGSCSHIRSYHYYAHSIWSKEDYVAYKCPSWDDFEAKLCDQAETNLMGEWVNKDGKNGDYYLEALAED